MGRRKSRKKPTAGGKKKAPKLATTFDCPFCNHSGSIKITIVKKAYAELNCTSCSEVKWSCIWHQPEQPIDIYSRWIDACSKTGAQEADQNEELLEADAEFEGPSEHLQQQVDEESDEFDELDD